MTDKEKLEMIQNRLDREMKYAYSLNQEESLEDVLQKKDRFEKVRMEAERAAIGKWRVENRSAQTELDKLLAEGTVKIWDLRDEKRRLKE